MAISKRLLLALCFAVLLASTALAQEVDEWLRDTDQWHARASGLVNDLQRYRLDQIRAASITGYDFVFVFADLPLDLRLELLSFVDGATEVRSAGARLERSTIDTAARTNLTSDFYLYSRVATAGSRLAAADNLFTLLVLTDVDGATFDLHKDLLLVWNQLYNVWTFIAQ